MPPAALKAFILSLDNLDYTRKRMERLYVEKKIALRDLHSVYEALFLRAVTGFEVFLEELFFSILEQKTTYSSSRVALRMTASSRGALRDILLQGDKYLTWIPFDNTEKRANLYLRDGRPFSDLSGGDKSIIKTITTIRNAIAHHSSHAKAEFERKVIGSQLLLRGEKKPAGFLRSQVRTAPALNRFQVYSTELARIARALC
jgi:hypothetical protein